MNRIKKVLPVLLLGNLLCMMDVSIMTIVLPEIQTAFNVNLTDLSWTLNIYMIMFATFIIPFGKLAEKVGRNKFVFAGLVIFGVGSLLTGISTNLLFMIGARIVQSIGAAIIIPTSMVIGLELSDQKNRHKIVAALAGVQGLAVALGPSIGGMVSQYWGWRWVFFINVPLILLDLFIYPLVLPLRNEQRFKIQIDWVGALLSMVMLFSFSLGLVKGNTWGWHSMIILSLFGLSFISLIVFILLESRLKSPMMDMRLFKNRNFVAAGCSLVLCNFFLGGMAVLIPTFLTRVHGESELHAALWITPYSFAVMISVIVTSLCVRRVNNKFLLAVGFILIGISYYLLSQMDLDRGYTELIIADIALGVGYGLVAATANILAVADFYGTRLTDSQSVANVLRQVGMVLAIAVFMTVLANHITTAKQQTINDGKSRIARLNGPSELRQRLIRLLNVKLATASNQVNGRNQQIQFHQIRISTQKVKAASQAAYQKRLKQIQVTNQLTSIKQIPVASRQRLKLIINQKVKRAAVEKTMLINHQLRRLIIHVKARLHHHLDRAFLTVYGNMVWLPFISLLGLPLFSFKKKNDRQKNRD